MTEQISPNTEDRVVEGTAAAEMMDDLCTALGILADREIQANSAGVALAALMLLNDIVNSRGDGQGLTATLVLMVGDAPPPVALPFPLPEFRVDITVSRIPPGGMKAD